jgi:GDSL-like Lipase/Acylhydrolase family
MPRGRPLVTLVALAFFGSAILFLVVLGKHSDMTSSKQTHIVLIGASIGQQWQLAEWPGRKQLSHFTAESIPAWQFDKSEVVGEVLMRPRRKFHPTRTYLKSLLQPPPRKPDIVILKECSSYFPGDLSQHQQSIRRWTKQLQQNGTKVILATVVPVTLSRTRTDADKQESLLRYNDWIREFARQNSIPVLDLEGALRRGTNDRYLKEEYAAPDGSHLNNAAYLVLDDLLKNTVCESGAEAGDECLQVAARTP